MSAGTATRKPRAKIRPPKTHVQGQAAVQDTWARFAKAVREIHNNNAHQLSYEEHYRYAYNLCLFKHGEMLYNGVCDLVSQNLDSLVISVITPAFPTSSKDDPVHRSQEGERLLIAFRKVWDSHTSSMSKLRDLLQYMDRTYVPGNNKPPIYDAGLDLFVQKILADSIRNILVGVILELINVERGGYVINRSAMKSCVDVLLQLGSPPVYKQSVEPLIFRDTESFYEAERLKLLDSSDAPQYLRHVESRLIQEEARAMHYLSSTSYSKIKDTLQHSLLTSALQTILLMPNSGLDPMMDGDKLSDLERMYNLFRLVDAGLPALRKELKLSIEKRGEAINAIDAGLTQESSTSDGRSKMQEKSSIASIWIQSVLELRDKILSVLSNAFQDDKMVEMSISEAFVSFINRNSKAPEYISLNIDEHLRKGLKGKTDAEVEFVLDKTISIFRYLGDKDIFERYYKNHLAKRLLNARSVSDDAERGMLAKLKVECGFQFTQKLEGMFNDIRISSDTTEAYKKHVANMETKGLDLSVIVMTSTFWPMNHSGATCTFPPELQAATKIFERFYLSRHSGRKLTWQPSLGNADVKVAFKHRKHDVNLPTMALVVLFLFESTEDDERLSYQEIQLASGIPDNDLQRNLQSLACGRYKLLKKSPASREVSKDDSFSFNHEFSSPLQKIKIGLVSNKVETTEERKETQEKVEEERRFAIEACIVRVMKDRKHFTHNELVSEVTRQLASRFKPPPLEIKKRIEQLIEKEYLERSPDKKSYNYVA